jgi:hypothetical protein
MALPFQRETILQSRGIKGTPLRKGKRGGGKRGIPEPRTLPNQQKGQAPPALLVRAEIQVYRPGRGSG